MSITACGTRLLKDNYLTWPHGIRCGTPKMQAADTNALVMLFCLLSRANCTVRWSCKWLIRRSSFLLFPIRRTVLFRISGSHLLAHGLPDIKERLSHFFYPEDGISTFFQCVAMSLPYWRRHIPDEFCVPCKPLFYGLLGTEEDILVLPNSLLSN